MGRKEQGELENCYRGIDMDLSYYGPGPSEQQAHEHRSSATSADMACLQRMMQGVDITKVRMPTTLAVLPELHLPFTPPRI